MFFYLSINGVNDEDVAIDLRGRNDNDPILSTAVQEERL
jgi:hypothetical protein